MPPISQQGSRAGLLTGLVLSAILAVTFLCTTIYFNSQNNATTQQNADLRAKYRDVIGENDMGGTDYQLLQAAKSQMASSPNAPQTLLATAERQRDDLAKKILSSAKDYNEAMTAADASTNNPAKALEPMGVTVPNTGGIWPVVQTLVKTIQQKNSQLELAQKNVKDANEKMLAAVESHKKDLADRDANVGKVQQDAAAQVSAANEVVKAKEAAVDEEHKKAEGAVTDNGAQLQKLVAEIQAKTLDIAKVTKKNDVLQHLVATHHVDPKDPIIRQPDGKIIKVANQQDVYIDLGSIDHGVSPGLTFQVYDRITGVPGIGSETDPISNDNLPVGKASIEIIRVGQNSSEARVTRLKPGEFLTEGDVIANIVYDRNANYNFFVYGDFDPERSGTWNAAKGEVIKSLVKRWGGTVVDHVGPDVDFVIIGREPEIPNFSKEDLERPENKLIYDNKKAALAAYTAVLNQAKELTIPILNQNRFLYYTGYYDLAKR